MAEELNKEGVKMEAEGVEKEENKDSQKAAQMLDSSTTQETQKEQPKDSLNVDQKRRSLTAEEWEEGAYRGTLTADQMRQYEDQQKKEVPVENTNAGDPARHNQEKKKTDAFKEQDIVEYMYNAWFLGGMSWLFDKIEEGVETDLNAMLYSLSHKNWGAASAEAKAASPIVQEFLDRVTNLGSACGRWTDKYAAECKDKEKRYKGYFDELNIDYSKLSPETEKALKEKYNERFIDQLKADYAEDPGKVKEFFKKAPEQVETMMSFLASTQKLAAIQAFVEMTDEGMQSVKKWTDKDTGKLKTDKTLEKELKARTNECHHKILVAVSAISEDARLLAKAEYINCDEDKRQEFVKTRVYDVYDQKISDAKSATEKEKFQAEKEKFKIEFEEAQHGEEMTPEAENVLFGKIASLEVNDYISKQTALVDEIRSFQDKELSKGHYDINDKHPDKAVKQKIDVFKKVTSDVTQKMNTDDELFEGESLKEMAIARRDLYEGVLGRRYKEVEGKRDLYEEVILGEKESNNQILESMQQIQAYRESSLKQKKKELEARKETFNKLLDGIETKEAIAQSNLAFAGKGQGR